MTERPLLQTAEEVLTFVNTVFPAVEGRFFIEDLLPMRIRLRRSVDARDIRPGGTVSGPAMFETVDCAFYMAVMAMIGPEALTVTTNATINFLNKPAPVDLICEARVLKLGKLLATGDATVYSRGSDRPVAHATLTYAIPPK
ncbi:MAG: PaaI family thioesterase [Pseudomonadota bacterium]